jgi:hypothetical protein
MYLSLFNIVKTLFTGGYGSKSQAPASINDDHTYIKGNIESRGPCPGLNALANQGYL